MLLRPDGKTEGILGVESSTWPERQTKVVNNYFFGPLSTEGAITGIGGYPSAFPHKRERGNNRSDKPFKSRKKGDKESPRHRGGAAPIGSGEEGTNKPVKERQGKGTYDRRKRGRIMGEGHSSNPSRGTEEGRCIRA